MVTENLTLVRLGEKFDVALDEQHPDHREHHNPGQYTYGHIRIYVEVSQHR